MAEWLNPYIPRTYVSLKQSSETHEEKKKNFFQSYNFRQNSLIDERFFVEN